MARPLRLEFPGAIYHVTSRGNARELIFLTDADRYQFCDQLKEVIEQYNWLCHTYCLMGNHYHLLIETPDGNLSRGMRHLNGVYTQRFNYRHDRVGHLFQGRYKAILVERESYLLELCRYIALNPVRAGIVDLPENYVWSSYLSIAGLASPKPWLTMDWILSQFDPQRINAQKAYAKFVELGIARDSPWSALHGQVLLGSSRFIAEMGPRVEEIAATREVPRAQRLLTRPSLANLFGSVSDTLTGTEKSLRDQKIRSAHDYGYRLSEISQNIGLHYSTISRIIKHER